MDNCLLDLFVDVADADGNTLHLDLTFDLGEPANPWFDLPIDDAHAFPDSADHGPATLPHPGDHADPEHGPGALDLSQPIPEHGLAHPPGTDHGASHQPHEPAALDPGHPVSDHGQPHDPVTDHGAGHPATVDPAHVSHPEHATAADDHAAHVGILTAGDPQGDSHHWHYQVPFGENSCAVASQTCILEEIFGHPFPESEMARLAKEVCHYNPQSGTPVNAMGNLLEYYGVHVTQTDNTSYDRIFDALEHGEKVIVAVNANEIWHPQVDAAGHPVNQPVAGHAVWLTGLQKDDNGHWYVILNDTGTPSGAGERVPIEHFDHAWKEFGCHAVVTNLHGTK
jgi:hypothetical protein